MSDIDINSNILDIRGGFVSPTFKTMFSNPITKQVGSKVLEMGKEAFAAEVQRTFNVDAQTASDYIDTAMNIVGVITGTTSADGGGDVIKVDRDQNNSGSGYGSRLDFTVSPIEVTLDTGLKPNVFTDYWRYYISGSYSPLHVNFVEMKISTSNTSPLYKFMESTVAPQFTTAIQRAVSFSVSTSLLTASNLIMQFNALLKCMSVYLFWDGVLSYCQSPSNRNDGMERFRKSLTATDITNLNSLRWALSSMPIPPNLRALVYWFYQTYQLSPLPGSALILNCPEDITTAGVPTNSISSALTALNDSTFRDTITLLAKACPTWVKGTFDSGNSNALHDENFTTLWKNCPLAASNTLITPTVNYPLSGNHAVYATATNDLDGAVLALYGFWDGSISNWTPGLTMMKSQAYTSACSNKWSYGDGDVFIPSHKTSEHLFQRGDVANLNPTVLRTSIPPGGQVLRGVTVESVLQTTTALLEWMLSFDTIGVIKDNKVYGSMNYGSGTLGKSKQPNSGKKYYRAKKKG